MKVGFIGLGNMGRPVARNIQRAGFDLIAHDIEKSCEKYQSPKRSYRLG